MTITSFAANAAVLHIKYLNGSITFSGGTGTDWRKKMARQKKQYPPIEGQTWWEKVLDRMTREDSFKFSMLLLNIYILLLLIPVYFMSTNPNSPYAAETFMKFWFGFFLPVSALAMLNPCSTGWGFRMGQKLQNPIKDYVELHGNCTYNELVAQFMPVKIHLGINDALEHLLNSHQLVFECNHYRLPTFEEKMNRHKALLDECGVKISFSDLEKIFALDLSDTEGSTSIEFSLLDELDSDYWIWKDTDDSSGKEQFFFSSAPKQQQAFPSFRAMAEANLFNGKNLSELWDNAVIIFFNDHWDINSWMQEHLHL